ncbi:hypothetical protein HanRHA438_Chr16g0769341 [Helianthus annuus]|nr:hypothetical protein HanRHA438_Chr16g0769341 [Helianthus annuus]
MPISLSLSLFLSLNPNSETPKIIPKIPKIMDEDKRFSLFHIRKRFKKQETLERIDSSETVTGSRSKAGAKSADVKHICMNLLVVKTQLYESE